MLMKKRSIRIRWNKAKKSQDKKCKKGKREVGLALNLKIAINMKLDKAEIK
jgi:hypothetical protein